MKKVTTVYTCDKCNTGLTQGVHDELGGFCMKCFVELGMSCAHLSFLQGAYFGLYCDYPSKEKKMQPCYKGSCRYFSETKKAPKCIWV